MSKINSYSFGIFIKYSDKIPTLRWNTTGITIAGVTGQFENASNKLNYPWGLDIDWANTLYIADQSNSRIQKYSKDALYGETVAGDPTGIFGTASNLLNGPCFMTVDSDDHIYVADRWNQRVQLWNRGASTGTTIAGVTGFIYFAIRFII